MKHPWQVWAWFLLGLAVVLFGMGWLTMKTLELDQAEAQARQQVELEERVSRALWRMDVLLMPLLAQEAARPDFAYHSVRLARNGAKGKESPLLSPLLTQPPDYVLLHFEMAPDGQVLSPQSPQGGDVEIALSQGVKAEAMQAAAKRVHDLQAVASHASLLACVPQQSLPTVDSNQTNWINSPGLNSGTNNSLVIANGYTADQAQSPEQAAEIPSKVDAVNQDDSTPSQSPFAFNGQPSQQAIPNGNNSRVGRGKISNDLQNRGAAYQAVAQRALLEQQRNNDPQALTVPRGVEGVSQPLWIGDRLILARRVQIGAKTVIQGCWLDWRNLQARLREEVQDLELPAVAFQPVTDPATAELNHLLATLPVQLAVAAPRAAPAWDSPLRISLGVAWSCLFIAAAAAAVTLHGVVALSERRGAFVSAVTHELRTPLTTFRMYAEMLAEGMVPEPERRQTYLDTLRREADRLAHLVENVLQYARLERGSGGGQRERLSLTALVDRLRPLLSDRAAQAEMQLEIAAIPAPAPWLETDPTAVEQILFNLVDNACKYAVHSPDKRIQLEIIAEARQVQLTVRDHGPGIPAAGRRKLFQPFSKSVHEAANSAPGVGLGLALSRRLARDLGGSLALEQADGDGAAFVLRLPAAKPS